MEDVKIQFLAIFNGVGLSILTVWLVFTIFFATLSVLSGADSYVQGRLYILVLLSIFFYAIGVYLFLSVSKDLAKKVGKISDKLN